jgi:hypothetical protein
VAIPLAVTAANAGQPTIQIRASASPTQLTLADTLEYRVEITGPSASGAQPQAPDFAALGLQVVQGPSSQQQIVMNNFQTQVTTVLRWALQPSREGTFDIGPTRVTLPGGQTLASNSVRVAVSKTAAPPPGAVPLPNLGNEPIYWARTGNDAIDKQLVGKLFLRPIINKTQAYVGEQITLRYVLYQAEALGRLGYGLENRPNPYPGFIVETLYQPPRGQLEFRRDTIGGVPFLVAPIESVALFANKTGSTSIPAMVMTAGLPIQSPGRQRPRSLFDDPFFDDFFADPFMRAQTVTARLVARPIGIQILPLPTEGRPTDIEFSGTVGEYQMSASFDRTQVKQFDLVNLKVQFTGKGQVDAVSPPRIPKVEGLERYKEQSGSQPSHVGEEAGGTKTFEFFLRPTKAGDIQFPRIEYLVFNPRDKKYEKLQTEPLTLHVAQVAESEKPQVTVSPQPTEAGPGGPSPVVELNRGIEYIRTTGFLSSALAAGPLYDRPGFLLLQMVPVALVGISFAVRRRREKREGDVAWARRRAARSVASKRLRGVGKLAAAAQSDRFFEELDRALRQFVADQVNESAVGLTGDQIAQVLSGRGIEEPPVKEMLSLLDLCESARYSNTRFDEGHMRQAFERASELIDQLAKTLRK